MTHYDNDSLDKNTVSEKKRFWDGPKRSSGEIISALLEKHMENRLHAKIKAYLDSVPPGYRSRPPKWCLGRLDTNRQCASSALSVADLRMR